MSSSHNSGRSSNFKFDLELEDLDIFGPISKITSIAIISLGRIRTFKNLERIKPLQSNAVKSVLLKLYLQ